MQRALYVIAGVFALAAVLFGTVYGLGGFQRLTADFRGETDQLERTQADGTFRIAAYERFFDLCASVQADEDRLEALTAELDSDQLSDRRREQVQASITGVSAARAEKIARYNADAAKEHTIGQFRDAGLPFQLDRAAEVTVCAR